MIMSVEMVGYIAAILTTSAFVPQVVLVWRRDDTRAISLGMYSLMVVGILMWLTYGLIIGDPPLIAANGVTFSLSCYILYKKIRHVRAGRA